MNAVEIANRDGARMVLFSDFIEMAKNTHAGSFETKS